MFEDYSELRAPFSWNLPHVKCSKVTYCQYQSRSWISSCNNSVFILGNPFVLVLFTASALLNILSYRHPHCMHYNHKGHENKQPWVTHFLSTPSPFVSKEPHNNNSIDLRHVLFIAKPCQRFNYKYIQVVNGAPAASVRRSSGKSKRQKEWRCPARFCFVWV